LTTPFFVRGIESGIRATSFGPHFHPEAKDQFSI
jgi:hypothetical protein